MAVAKDSFRLPNTENFPRGMHVAAGTVFPDDHPAVKAYPELFMPEDAYPYDTINVDVSEVERVVEDATSRPGVKRAVKNVVKKAKSDG